MISSKVSVAEARFFFTKSWQQQGVARSRYSGLTFGDVTFDDLMYGEVTLDDMVYGEVTSSEVTFDDVMYIRMVR